jgi:hypothetical protein
VGGDGEDRLCAGECVALKFERVSVIMRRMRVPTVATYCSNFDYFK